MPRLRITKEDLKLLDAGLEKLKDPPEGQTLSGDEMARVERLQARIADAATEK